MCVLFQAVYLYPTADVALPIRIRCSSHFLMKSSAFPSSIVFRQLASVFSSCSGLKTVHVLHKNKCHNYRPEKRGYPPSLAVYMESASTASERELGEGVGKDARYMGTLWEILYYTFQSTCLHFSTPVERDPPCCTTYEACKDFHAWGWGRGLTWTQHLASSSASQIRTDTCGETADSNSTSSQMRNHQSFSQPLGLHPVPDSLTPSYA